MEGTLFTPARTVQDIQEIQVGAMATATIQMGGAKGRVQVSIVEGTMLTPAMIVGEIEECAMAIATGHGTIRRLKGTAEGRVHVSIVEGTKLTPAMNVGEKVKCAMATATGQAGGAEGGVFYFQGVPQVKSSFLQQFNYKIDHNNCTSLKK